MKIRLLLFFLIPGFSVACGSGGHTNVDPFFFDDDDFLTTSSLSDEGAFYKTYEFEDTNAGYYVISIASEDFNPRISVVCNDTLVAEVTGEPVEDSDPPEWGVSLTGNFPEAASCEFVVTTEEARATGEFVLAYHGSRGVNELEEN